MKVEGYVEVKIHVDSHIEVEDFMIKKREDGKGEERGLMFQVGCLKNERI